MVQPDVKSNTWNDRTTFFWPLYWLKVMSPSLTEGSLKSGATSPTSPDISQPFCTKLVNSCSLVGAPERLYPRTGHLTTMVIGLLFIPPGQYKSAKGLPRNCVRRILRGMAGLTHPRDILAYIAAGVPFSSGVPFSPLVMPEATVPRNSQTRVICK